MFRHGVEIRDHVALDPFNQGLLGPERYVKLVALIRNQRERKERSAPAIIFRVEEVAHRRHRLDFGNSSVQSPMGQEGE